MNYTNCKNEFVLFVLFVPFVATFFVAIAIEYL